VGKSWTDFLGQNIPWAKFSNSEGAHAPPEFEK